MIEAFPPDRPDHAVKNGRRYRYYISREPGERIEEASPGWRLPAKGIEGVVLAGVRAFLDDPTRLMDAAQDALPSQERPSPDVWTRLNTGELSRDRLKGLITRIDLARDSITLQLDMRRVVSVVVPSTDKPDSSTITAAFPITLPITLKRRGSEMRIVLQGQTTQSASTDKSLVTMIARAHIWFKDLKSGNKGSLEDIARTEQMSASDVSRYLPLAFLAPDIVEAILGGSQPADLTLQKIKRMPPLPMSWQDQRIRLGFQG